MKCRSFFYTFKVTSRIIKKNGNISCSSILKSMQVLKSMRKCSFHGKILYKKRFELISHFPLISTIEFNWTSMSFVVELRKSSEQNKRKIGCKFLEEYKTFVKNCLIDNLKIYIVKKERMKKVNSTDIFQHFFVCEFSDKLEIESWKCTWIEYNSILDVIIFLSLFHLYCCKFVRENVFEFKPTTVIVMSWLFFYVHAG